MSLYRAAEELTLTDELPNKTRTALAPAASKVSAAGVRPCTACPTPSLPKSILDESGYTEMWQNDKSPEAEGRLENLKELVRSMGEFENMAGFLEHIALVMDRDSSDAR